MSYFMTDCSHVNCISQGRQIHMGTHTYHMCNILFNLAIMLDFFIITDIATFDLSHNEPIQSLQIISVFLILNLFALNIFKVNLSNNRRCDISSKMIPIDFNSFQIMVSLSLIWNICCCICGLNYQKLISYELVTHKLDFNFHNFVSMFPKTLILMPLLKHYNPQ